jgi:hypothetical protein
MASRACGLLVPTKSGWDPIGQATLEPATLPRLLPVSVKKKLGSMIILFAEVSICPRSECPILNAEVGPLGV